MLPPAARTASETGLKRLLRQYSTVVPRFALIKGGYDVEKRSLSSYRTGAASLGLHRAGRRTASSSSSTLCKALWTRPRIRAGSLRLLGRRAIPWNLWWRGRPAFPGGRQPARREPCWSLRTSAHSCELLRAASSALSGSQTSLLSSAAAETVLLWPRLFINGPL